MESSFSPVSNPIHYTQGSIESRHFISAAVEHLSGIDAFYVANVIKYIWRAEQKGGIQDLEKAKTYIEFYSERYFNDFSSTLVIDPKTLFIDKKVSVIPLMEETMKSIKSEQTQGIAIDLLTMLFVCRLDLDLLSSITTQLNRYIAELKD